MHYFLSNGRSVPYPIESYKETVRRLIDAQGIDIEELLTFCFCVAKNGKIIVDREKYGGECFWLAFASGVLSLKESSCYPFAEAIAAAVEGQISFTDYFIMTILDSWIYLFFGALNGILLHLPI